MTEMSPSNSVNLTAASVAIDWPLRRRLAMVALGYIPLLLAVVVVISALFASYRWGVLYGLLTGFVLLYLLPPLLHRATSLLLPLLPGRHGVSSGAFLRWWLSAQLQVIFNRLPVLEESLRIVPGLYSAWLRLWGAKIGSLVYWSPGVAPLDRPFLHIGNRVVFGAGARLNPHVIVPGKKGEAQLWLAPVTLGDDSLIGGYCLITSGCTIPSGASVPAGKYLRPFSTWHDRQPAEIRFEGDSP